MSKKMIHKKDIVLIGSLLALAAGAFLALPFFRRGPIGTQEPRLYIRYQVGGEEAALLPLTREERVVVNQGEGKVNTLRVWPGGVEMESSSCHNQLCVYQGPVTPDNWDSRPLMAMIVCAPHRLVVELLEAAEPPPASAAGGEGENHEDIR
ncbi:MAG: NusG domain II-containing protein [Clostridia bacterium]|nr:NusG domain II-containing protein [Clostridia bacterium]